MSDELKKLVEKINADKASEDLVAARRAIIEKLSGQKLEPSHLMAPISETDKTAINEQAPRNWLVNKFGLPQSWKQTVAEEKSAYQHMPEELGNAIGSVKVIDKTPIGTGFGKIIKLGQQEQPVGKIIKVGQGQPAAAPPMADLMNKPDIKAMVQKAVASGQAQSADVANAVQKITGKVLPVADKVNNSGAGVLQSSTASNPTEIVKKMLKLTSGSGL